ERAPRQSVVDISESQKRPRENAQNELIDASGAGGHDASDQAIGNERAVENRVVAARGAHTEDVPRFDDREAVAFSRKKSVNDFRFLRIAGVHPVQTEVGPDGSEAAERFSAREFVSAVHTL